MDLENCDTFLNIRHSLRFFLIQLWRFRWKQQLQVRWTEAIYSTKLHNVMKKDVSVVTMTRQHPHTARIYSIVFNPEDLMLSWRSRVFFPGFLRPDPWVKRWFHGEDGDGCQQHVIGWHYESFLFCFVLLTTIDFSDWNDSCHLHVLSAGAY